MLILAVGMGLTGFFVAGEFFWCKIVGLKWCIVRLFGAFSSVLAFASEFKSGCYNSRRAKCKQCKTDIEFDHAVCH